MSDIVEQLRHGVHEGHPITEAAADEIERLRAALTKIAAAYDEGDDSEIYEILKSANFLVHASDPKTT